jgi:hypothetical protein
MEGTSLMARPSRSSTANARTDRRGLTARLASLFLGSGPSSVGDRDGRPTPHVSVAHVVLLLVALAALLLVPAAASGAPKSTVAVFGQGDPDDPSVPPVSAPAGLAVHQGSGDVYVIDANYDRIQQFDQDGVFIRTWGTPGSAEGQFSFFGQYAGIAVAPDGSVYVADAGNNRIQKFEADGTFVSTWGWDVLPDSDPADPLDDPEIGFEVCTSGCQAGTADPSDGAMSNPIGVAVNPTDGTVVVADQYNNRVQRFDADGNYQAQFPTNSAQSVAVDSGGFVYVVEQFGSLLKFDADGNQLDFFPGNGPRVVTVDPATDHVFVAQDHYDADFNLDGMDVGELDTTGTVLEEHRYRRDTTDAFGVAVNSTSGRIYASQTYEDRVFILDDPVQSATVQPATDVTSRTATLNGTVNPGGDLAVGYRFEVSADDGQTWTPFPEVDENVGSGTSDIAVSQPATGLEPNREYRVRLVVTNEFGSRFTSAAITFTTEPEPPNVETLPATQITSTSGLLTGEINPNNTETSYHFEWGNSTSYGTSMPVPDASAGADGSPVTVAQQLDGLLPNAVYHYRLVATNVAGTSEGEDRTFTTRPAATPPEGRGFELVTPAYKIGGQGTGSWHPEPAGAVAGAGIAAHDGERFASQAIDGGVMVDSAFGYRSDVALGERTFTGWVHHPATTRTAHAGQPTVDMNMKVATPDLLTMAWMSAKTLRLFPEMADWSHLVRPLLLSRWTEPQFQVFGPTDPSQEVSEPHSGNNDAFQDYPASFAADGSAVVASAGGGVRGLAGPGDPTLDMTECFAPTPACSQQKPGAVYLDELTGSFSDVFPGDDGVRELVNVCTGTGAERTVLPSGPCPDPLPGRDWRMTSDEGGAALASDLPSGGSAPTTIMSADGSRVFFMSPDPNGFLQGPDFGPAQLFVRQRGVDGQVVVRWISWSEIAGQDASLRAPAIFEGASRDGDKVFFRTISPLTVDDPNGGRSLTSGSPDFESSDLYMYDLPDGPDGDPATPDADPDGGDLTRISAGPGEDSDCNVELGIPGQPGGAARFVSDDASRVYFTCAAPLTGPVAAADGTVTAPGGTTTAADASNLYLYDAARPAAQRWRFIARLPRTSTLGKCATRNVSRGSPFYALNGSFLIDAPHNCVRGTSDGSLLTLFTDGRLTADDPDASSGDVYGYDVVRDELSRMSAAQSGVGGDYQCAPEHPSNNTRCHGDGGLNPGLSVGAQLEVLGVATRPNGDRLAFFQSRSRLVAQDTDGAYDVYQWRDGELTLLTVGDSDTFGAFFVGNDRTGQNVYFATRDQLTWQDKDRVFDVYTVRVDGGIPEPVSPAGCVVLADGCQGGGAAVVQPQVGSGAGGGDVSPGARKALSLGRLTAAQRRRAARTGRIALRVRTTSAGRVSLAARAKVAGRTRVVGRASKRVAKPGVVTVALRLSGRARAVLARGRELRVSLRASQPGVRSRSITVALRRTGK